ncbi:MAG: methylmalonyl-CoA mutase family protein, partial [bacterium]
RALDDLKRAADAGENTMYKVLECVKAGGTMGEICDVFRAVYGEYREPAII